MSDEQSTALEVITLSVLGQHVQLKCPPEKADTLRRAAEQLNSSAKQLRHAKMLVNPNRLAIMAALQLACEQDLHWHEAQDAQSDIANQLIEKIDTVLED